MTRTDSWAGLIEETRQALSNLRADDLEDLVVRAQEMFGASVVLKSQQKHEPELCSAELVKVVEEHRLLGDLLIATDKNLAVVRRLQGRSRDRTYADEGHPRWVR
jgi:hypothetical protein